MGSLAMRPHSSGLATAAGPYGLTRTVSPGGQLTQPALVLRFPAVVASLVHVVVFVQPGHAVQIIGHAARPWQVARVKALLFASLDQFLNSWLRPYSLISVHVSYHRSTCHSGYRAMRHTVIISIYFSQRAMCRPG